jgi:outer membrane lipoprotein-sorting protein
VQKVGNSPTRAFSGTVRLSIDIGLPKLPKLGTDGGADPLRLLSGDHIVRVVADATEGAQRERIALLDTMSEYDIVRDDSDLWLWDSTRQLARHTSVDALTEALLSFASPAELAKTFTGPAAIKTAVFDTDYSSGQTTRVAGRDCYVLRITPNTPGTTVGAVRVAVDAATGVPLSVTVYPAGSSKAAIRAEFEELSYRADPAELRFTPPPGATVVEERAPDLPENPVRGTGTGWTAAVVVGGVDPDKVIAGLGTDRGRPKAAPEGTAAVLAALAGTPGTPLQSYLRMMMAAGEKTAVGLVWSSRLVSLVFTPDQRLYAAFATPDALVATVAADDRTPTGGSAGVRGR